jgi:uncharacterized protein (AIM24 family)
MSDRDGSRPPSSRSREAAGEEFLFHLYRGSELLQDNRVHDAKAALEQALSLQPSDPKGQDLLGIVYFRLGLYPRAIAIYERLIQAHPQAIEPRINLALSYLKTGQASQARSELEKVVEQNPGHSRAWGYLGLAFQRLGDLDRASYAFAAGGYDAMARRLLEMGPSSASASRLPEPPVPARDDVRKATGEAFQELDRAIAELASGSDGEATIGASPTLPDAELRTLETAVLDATEPGVRSASVTGAGPASTGPRSTSYADAAPRSTSFGDAGPSSRDLRPSLGLPSGEGGRSGGMWSAFEPGRETLAAAPPRMHAVPPPPSAPISRALFPEGPASWPRRPQATGPKRAQDLANELRIVTPRDAHASVHASGLVMVQSAHGFAARIAAVRSLALGAGYGTTALKRRSRGRESEEPLGGKEAPIIEISGKGEVLLAPEAGQRLVALQLDDEPVYLREDALMGLDLSITYENGRIPSVDGEPTVMVQLRGYGAVVAALPERAVVIEAVESRSTSVRAAAVVGWMGRLVPRALLSTEAPGGARGFIAFAGEGMVIVDGR